MQFEVELFSWKSSKDLTDGEGAVLKTVIDEGTGWDKPDKAAEVCISFDASLNDTQIDSAEAKWATIGDGSLCRAFEVALPTMKKGEKAQLTVRADYAAGLAGLPTGLATATTVDCKLTLVSWRKVERLADGAISKKILEEGTAYKKPEDGSKVTIELKRVLTATKSVLSERATVEYVLGDGTQSLALDEVVASMKKGEDVVATCAGSLTAEDPVAASADLELHVRLVDFDEVKQTWDMSVDERLSTAIEVKQAGNAFFKEGRWQRACKKYSRALKALDVHKDEEKAKVKTDKVAIHNNLATCYAKQRNWSEAISQCNKALELDKANAKALFRRASSLMETGELARARLEFKAVLEADGSAQTKKDVHAALTLLKKLQDEQDKKDKTIFGSMFASKRSLYDEKKAAPKKAAAGDGATTAKGEANGESTEPEPEKVTQPEGPGPQPEPAPMEV